MLVPFSDASARLLSFVHSCPELRKEFDSPRYYPAESHPVFFDSDNKPLQLDQGQLAEKGRLFLRRFIGPSMGSSAPALFNAYGPDGEKLWIMRDFEQRLVHGTGDGSRATREVEYAEMFLDQAELDAFFELAAPGRQMFLGWEAACLLAGEKPEPLWKHVLRQTEPHVFANRVGVYREELAAVGLLPVQMVGKLKLYSWEAIEAWAVSKGIKVPVIDGQTEPGDSVDFLRFHQVERILAERFGSDAEAIGHEIAAWVFFRELDAYIHANELDDQCLFHFPEANEFRRSKDFNQERPYDYLPLLERCYFKKSDIARFIQLGPMHRYIYGMALLERWEKLRGSKDKAKALIVAGIEDSILLAVHPIYAGPDVEEILPEDDLDYRLPPVELCLYPLDGALEIEGAPLEWPGQELLPASPEIAPPGTASSPEPAPSSDHEAHQGEESPPDGQSPAIAETGPTATPPSAAESPQASPEPALQAAHEGHQDEESLSDGEGVDGNGEYWAELMLELAEKIKKGKQKLSYESLWTELALHQPKNGTSEVVPDKNKDDRQIIHTWPSKPPIKKKLKFGSFRKRKVWELLLKQKN